MYRPMSNNISFATGLCYWLSEMIVKGSGEVEGGRRCDRRLGCSREVPNCWVDCEEVRTLTSNSVKRCGSSWSIAAGLLKLLGCKIIELMVG